MVSEIRRHRRRPLLRPILTLASFAGALLLGAPSALAQSGGASDAPTAGWQNGFFLQSADGANRLQLGLLTQFDGRFAVDDEADALTDSFVIRRLRPSLRGRIGDRFEFFLSPDFAGGTLVVQDAYFDTRFSPAFRVRVGKGKTPFGYERLQSASTMLFIERALPTAVAPNRDLGIQLLGDVANNKLSYAVGIFNGTRDGANVDVDNNDGKDLIGRVVVRPVDGLTVALAGSTGSHRGPASLPSYRTTVFQQTFFSYDGASADGRLNRYSPYLSYYSGPFGAFVEYVRSSLPVDRGELRETIGHQAWQAAASWVLTGERTTENGVVPERPFSFSSGGGKGALQLALRYQELSVDNDAFALGLASASSNRKAEAWSVGLNWYLNRNLLYRLHYERTSFEDGSARPTENTLAFRSQINF
jgi:phosphate-selective porin OprO/OprP